MTATGGTVAWDQKCPATRGRGPCTCAGARTTTAVPLPELAVDLTPGAAWFISRAVTALGKAADILRNAPSLNMPAAMIHALAGSGLQYDPDGPAIYQQDHASGVRVSITLRDGTAVLGITGVRS